METLRFLMVSTFYPPYHLGGDAVHVQYLAEALAAAGHEVHVEFSPAAYGVKRRGTPPVAGVTPKEAVHLHPVTRPSQRTSPLAAYLLGDSGVVRRAHERLVREIGPDVVHLHNISLLGLGVQVAPPGRPILYTAHDYWFRCPRSDLLKYGRTPCVSPSCLSCMVRSRRVPPPWRGPDIASRMRRVHCVIAPSRFMKALAAASFRCPVVHIPNFVPDENPEGLVRAPAPYFLYAGVFEKHKGLLELAEAADHYRGPNQFVLVGRGSEEGRLRSLASRPGSKVDVRAWADRATLSALFREAAAFLMPSTCLENAPLAAIEALSWGAPLLTTSRGGVPELLDGGAAGRAFEPDSKSLTRALEEFDAVPDPLSLRRAARRAYEAHHRPEGYVTRYLALVRAVASGEPADPDDATRGATPPSRVLTQDA